LKKAQPPRNCPRRRRLPAQAVLNNAAPAEWCLVPTAYKGLLRGGESGSAPGVRAESASLPALFCRLPACSPHEEG